MEKKYFWLAVRVNIAVFFISILVGFIAIPLLLPLLFVFGISLINPLLFAGGILFFAVLLAFIPQYLAFKYVYKNAKKTENVELTESILYSIALMVIVSFIFDVIFTPDSLQDVGNYFSYAISAVFAYIAFYFAGKKVDELYGSSTRTRPTEPPKPIHP